MRTDINDLSLFEVDNRNYVEMCEEFGMPAPEVIVSYGEGYEAMGKHVAEMSGLNRIIFQECRVSGGKVVAPHENVEASFPYWFSPRWISRKLKCSLRDAATLGDCWSILDATKEMVDTFIKWTFNKFPEGFAYFQELASKVAEAEVLDPEDALYPEDKEVVKDHIAFHVIGDYGKPVESWLSKQSPGFMRVFSRIKNCPFSKLKELGKDLYKNPPKFSNICLSVLWTEYGIRKKHFAKQFQMEREANRAQENLSLSSYPTYY